MKSEFFQNIIKSMLEAEEIKGTYTFTVHLVDEVQKEENRKEHTFEFNNGKVKEESEIVTDKKTTVYKSQFIIRGKVDGGKVEISLPLTIPIKSGYEIGDVFEITVTA
ncbi:hypothetical protein ACLB83_002564 [Escherichia coli]